MKSTISRGTNRKRLENQECRLHSLYSCSLCQYDGTYSLDIENPTHQAVISDFLAKSRKKNYRELMYERINERRNHRRRFLKRIREQPREQVVATDEISVLSSDDETDTMTPAPAQVNTVQVQGMQHPAAVPTVSRNHHTVGRNISNTFPKRRLFGTRFGITMPADTPAAATAHARAVDSEVEGAGIAKTGAPGLDSTSRPVKDSESVSRASVIRCSFVPSSSSRMDATAPARTDVNHSSSPGRETTYSACRLSLPNSSATSFASSERNLSSRKITSRQGEPPDQMDEPDTDEALRKTAPLMSRFRQTSPLIPDVSMNTFQAKSSSGEVNSAIKIARPSVSNTHSREVLLRRTPPVSGSVSNQHTPRFHSVIDSRSSMLNNSYTAEGHTMVSRNTMIPPPTCYSHSGGFAPVKLCSEKCSEGRCYIVKCSSKDCPTYIPNSRTDGNCSETKSLVRFSPAQGSQPQQQKTTLPGQINMDKRLKVPLQTRISRPPFGGDPTSSSFIESNLRNRAPYRFERIESTPPFPPQANRAQEILAGHSTNGNSMREVNHSYGRPTLKAVESLVKTHPSPENTSSPGPKKRKWSPERADSRSPEEVVESFLTRKLSSSAPRSGAFSTGRLQATGIPSSSGADLSLPAINKIVASRATQHFTADHAGSLSQANATLSRESTRNNYINSARDRALALFNRCISASANAAQTKLSRSLSSYKNNLEVEEPPMKKVRYVFPETTTATVVGPGASSRTPSSSTLPNSNGLNATPRPAVKSAVRTSISRQYPATASVESAMDETERLLPAHMRTNDLLGPGVPVISPPSGSMLNLQPEQPLPPFENIIGKFPSLVKLTPPENETQLHRDKRNLYLQNILDWLLKTTSDPLLPMLQSTTAKGNSKPAAPIIPASRSDDIHHEDAQKQKPLIARRPAGIRNRRTLMPPTRLLPKPALKPSQGSQERQGDQGSHGSVSKQELSPYKHIKAEFDGRKRKHIKESAEPSSQRIRCPRSEDFVIRCEGHRGFKVSASILERASPTLKDFAEKCCRWYEIDGLEYRTFDVLGVTHWAMLELLKFAVHDSYNHNLMRTSHMKRLLDMLQIKYKQTQTFIFPVEPQSTDLL